MKKYILQFGLTLSLITAVLLILNNIAYADSIVTTALEMLKAVKGNLPIPDYRDSGQHPDSTSVLAGVSTATSAIYYAIDVFRYAISGIAFIVIIIASITLVSTSAEDEASKSKDQLLYGVVGLLVIQIATYAVKKMFFGDQGEAFSDIATTQYFAEETVRQIRGIIGLVNIFLGAAAVLVIVIKGATLIYEGGEEDSLSKAKEQIVYAIIGLVVVGISEVVVRGFVFPDGGTALPNLSVGRKLLASITNYVSSVVAILAFLSLIFSGYQYAIAGGSEDVVETVKRTVFGAVIALLLAFGAFAAVNTIVTLDNTSGSGNSTTSNNYLITESETHIIT